MWDPDHISVINRFINTTTLSEVTDHSQIRINDQEQKVKINQPLKVPLNHKHTQLQSNVRTGVRS